MDQPTTPVEANEAALASATSETNAQNQPPELVDVNSLDQFVQALVAWHRVKTDLLKHMQQIPEGVEITADVGEGPQPISGDVMKGFKFGLAFALGELGTLPFEVEFEADDEPAPATAATGCPSLN